MYRTMVKVELHLYDRIVREVHDYADLPSTIQEDVINFVKNVAGKYYYNYNVVTKTEETKELSFLLILIGRYSTEVILRIPIGMTSRLNELAGAIKGVLDAEGDADLIIAIGELLRLFEHKFLWCEENYVNTEISIEHSESEGGTIRIYLQETFG